ncbi:MAG: diacylglycerol/polyprenol kinase family protein [Candidatus Hermodarchaeota archaeon]
MNILLDLLILLLTFIYVLATIIIPVQLKKRDKITKFQARKAVHLLAGLAVLSTPYYSWPWWAVILASSMALLTLLSSKKSQVKQLKDLYDSIGEEAEEKVGYLQGPFNYCLSITILVTLFVILAPNQMYFPIAGILLMIISDTLASIVGKKYGKRKINIPWVKTVRTLEGSLAFFVSGFILCLIAFTFLGVTNPITQIHLSLEAALLYSLITSVLATIVELISPSTWDDLTIPIATVLIVFLLTLI